MPSFQAFPELPDWFWYPITFMYGAIVGSFLNVIIYRLPLGLSLNRPPSSCPNCGNKLRMSDNIPMVAFLALRGRCGFCRTPISWRYFSIEMLTACLWTALYARVSGTTGISWVDYVAQALFVSVLIAMIFIDIDHFIAPDELNIVGFVLGLGRDIVCVALAWYASHGTHGYVWIDNAPHFLYFGWLPRAIPGALLYGGILYLVSMAGFVVYARGENESLGSVLKRFFTLEDLPEESAGEVEATEAAGEVAALEAAENETSDNASATAAVVHKLPPENPAAVNLPEDSDDEMMEEEEEGDPPRLRFSPGLLAIISALVLAPLIRGWAVIFLVFPVVAFLALSRRPGEAVGAAISRFFLPADDDNYSAAPAAMPDEDPVDVLADLPGDIEYEDLTPAQRAALAKVESDQFAREAETGSRGGMGLGDVKLALAVGAVLGPGLALLSLMIATFVGAIVGATLARIHGRNNLKLGVPFVPFMAIGAIVAMLYGPAIMDWYQTLFVPAQSQPQMPVPVRPYRPHRDRTIPLEQVPPQVPDPSRPSAPAIPSSPAGQPPA